MSTNYLDDNFIYCNIRGLGEYEFGYGEIQNNCIMNHNIDGIYLDNSWIYLGYGSTDGNNAIRENNQREIDICNDAFIAGGGMDMGGVRLDGKNEISHSINTIKRLRSNNSAGDMEYNWWGVAPYSCTPPFSNFIQGQIDSLFYITPAGSVVVDSAMCDRGRIKDCQSLPDCSTGSIAPIITDLNENNPINMNYAPLKKGASPIPFGIIFRTAHRYAQQKIFYPIYQLIDGIIQQSYLASEVSIAAKLILQLEMNHVRKYPDSLNTSFNRLSAFLQSHFNNATGSDIKAVLLQVLSECYFNFGDINSSELKVNQLLNNYPSSDAAKKILFLKQLISMAKRDTIGVDTTINQMINAGYSADDMRIANVMKYAFLRVKPKNMISKRLFETESQSIMRRTAEQLLSLTSIRNYPNPFGGATYGNPSTILEYNLPQESMIVLKVFSMLGKRIETLVDGKQKSGKHVATFNASHTMPAGMYFYVLSTEYGNVIGKMMYVK